MAIVHKIDRDGVDVVIEKLQDYTFPNLSGFWLGTATYESYPRANKNFKKEGNIIPEVSLDEKEYKSVLNVDKFSVTSFFLTEDNRVFDKHNLQFTQTISMIFQADLVELYGKSHRADEEFNMDVIRILKKNKSYIFGDITLTEGVNNVYSDLTITGVLKDKINLTDKSQFHVLKATFDVVYSDTCPKPILPTCVGVSIKVDDVFDQVVPSGGSYNCVTTGSPADVELNGSSLTPTGGGDEKIMTIEFENGNPVVITPVTDTATVFDGTIPNPAQSKEVYYNRPWLKTGTSYLTNDEPSRAANNGNAYNEAIPDLATIQQLDFTGGLMDKLVYFNFWGHKFRFFGINGGYCNPADGLYYDKDGVLSTKLIEFPLFNVTSYWIIDGLTGFMMPAAGFGNTTYSANLITAAASTLEGFTDYFVFSRDELYVLADGSYNNCIHPTFRPPFNNPGTNWSCTPWQVAPSTNALAFTGSLGGSTSQQGYSHAGFQEFYGRIHLTGSVTQP